MTCSETDRGRGIGCPKCGGRLGVSATERLNNRIFRRRICEGCGAGFRTVEKIIGEYERHKHKGECDKDDE